MIAPSTDIILYKSDLELDNTNQLKFDTWNAQWAYFSNLPHIYLDNATYQRKEGVIRFPTQDISFDELIRYNYVSYKNEAYANKTFFAYVKNMRYVNDGMTEIEIETDPFQTWQFDIVYRKCFTEREHVKDDTFGKHTVPEGLETGPYMYQKQSKKLNFADTWVENDSNDTFCIIAATSDTGFPHTGVWTEDTMYNGVANGFWYISFPNDLELKNWINAMQSLPSNKSDAIYCIFTCYNSIAGVTVEDYEQITWRGYTFSCSPVLQHQEPGSIRPTSMRSKQIYDDRIIGKNYKPKNNKLYCYPYRFITVSNNAGQTNHYRYELFKDGYGNPTDILQFDIWASISPGLNIKLYPVRYNEVDFANYPGTDYDTAFANFSEGLDGPKLPMCGWNTDAFLNWLSQNGINLSLGTAVNVTEIVGGAALVASGAGAGIGPGLIIGGASGIASSIKEGVQSALEPDTAKGGANSGTLNFACKRLFTPYLMSINDEYAKIIDDYFTMFGYKVATLKIPEIHSRRNWNYIKTIDCNFSGDIPGDDLVKLRQMFNNGITLWHNPSTFLDYSQSNNII